LVFHVDVDVATEVSHPIAFEMPLVTAFNEALFAAGNTCCTGIAVAERRGPKRRANLVLRGNDFNEGAICGIGESGTGAGVPTETEIAGRSQGAGCARN
jgi:hypothetical protein